MHKLKDNLIKDFCRGHWRELIFAALAVLLCWQKNAFTQNVRVDTEVFIANPGTLQGWMDIGRPAMLPLKYILGNLIYNPYYGGFLFLVFFSLLTAGWMYLLWLCSGKNERLWVFGGLFASCQTWAYMFYFNMMAAEVAAAMLLESVALLVLTRTPMEKSLKAELKRSAAVAMLIFAFGCFQALVPMFITGAAICILLRLDSENDRGDEPSPRGYIKMALNYVVPFLIAFVIYWVINSKFFMSGSAYFAYVNQWYSQPKRKCAADIMKVIAETFGAAPYKYSLCFGAGCLGALYFFAEDMIKGRLKGRVWMYVLSFAVILISPFVIAVYFGGYFIARMQYCTQLAGAFLCWYVLGRVLQKEKAGKCAGAVLTVLLCIVMVFQLSVIQRLMYTDDVRQTQDERVAADVVKDLEAEFGNSDMPVVFMGMRQCPLNGLCLTVDEMYGNSVICWDYWPDKPSSINPRARGFIKSVYGVDYPYPTPDQCLAAEQAAAGRPCYPADGYIFESNGVIVVKLGE